MRAPNIKFTVDIGHCLQNDDPYEAFFKRHVDHIADVHLHDGVTRGPAHLAFGTGQLDLERFVRLVQDTNYRGFVTLEMLSQEDTAKSWEELVNLEEKVSRCAMTCATL
jgi:sugar phosphate isomerase/epimerase